MPAQELRLFELQIQRARDLVGTAVALGASLTGAMNVSDLYRAAFVQSVSALDTFVHGEVRARMLSVFSNGDPSTAAFDRFKVSLSSVKTAIANSGDPATQYNWLDAEVQEQHSFLSFQHPDKVADAIRLVSGVTLWDAVAAHIGQPPVGGDAPAKMLKRRLTLIDVRQNTIVHESDLDPTPPGNRLYPMDRATAEGAIDTIEEIVHAIAVVI